MLLLHIFCSFDFDIENIHIILLTDLIKWINNVGKRKKWKLVWDRAKDLIMACMNESKG